MKIVVIGGTGLIGSKLVARLAEHGHEAIPASTDSGVNTLTGEGLAEVLEGASVVVDVSNSPSFEDAAVLEFFETSTRNLLAAEAAAGVGHHVALSVVGTDRLSESGYFRAKIAQERLITAASVEPQARHRPAQAPTPLHLPGPGCEGLGPRVGLRGRGGSPVEPCVAGGTAAADEWELPVARPVGRL